MNLAKALLASTVLLLTACATATPPLPKNIEFESYSSSEKHVVLAYLFDLDDKWKFAEMEKNGSRFSVSLPVQSEVWYEFVADPNTWYKKDPFNGVVDHDHPYIKVTNGRVSNRNNKTQAYSSEHFDLFTTKDGRDLAALEAMYTKLTKTHLSFLGEISPVNRKKVRYYDSIFKGMYALSWTGEVVDEAGVLNSHELIHVLLNNSPKYPPFAEGIAQCFQERGNKLPLAEANFNLASHELINSVDLYDTLKNWSAKQNYHLVASFLYYHLFVDLKSRPAFINLLKSLTSDQMPFSDFESLFQKTMGKDLKVSIAAWKVWVSKLDAKSKVYVDWS